MIDEREPLLARAGLEVLGTAVSAGTLLPAEAWKRIVSTAAVPTVEIPDDADDYLDQVDAQWRRLADESGVFGKDGAFLISPAGPRSMERPWVVVRLTSSVRLARHLTARPGEPEFVTAAQDGHVVLGVTTEEYGIWLVRAYCGIAT